MGKGNCTPLVALLSVLQVGTSIAVIAIIAVQLANVDSADELISMDPEKCVMGPDPTNTSPCLYGMIVGGVSIVLVIVIGILQLITCNMCGCGPLLDLIFAGLAVVWWVVASLVLSGHGGEANKAGLPQKSWRNAVIILCWATACLFGLLFLLHAVRVGIRMCNCCGRKKEQQGYDVEKTGLAPGNRPPSAAIQMGDEVRTRSYMMGRSQSNTGRGANGFAPRNAQI